MKERSNLDWLNTFREKLQTGRVHSFVFYQNVWDDIVKDGQLKRIYEVLSEEETISQAAIIVYFNRCTGVRFADDDSPNPVMKKLFIRLVIGDPKLIEDPDQFFETNKRDLSAALKWFNNLLEIGWDNEELQRGDIKEYLSARFSEAEDIPQKGPFAVVIFEYEENLASVDSSSSSQKIERDAVTFFQWWAQDRKIQKTQNIIIYISEALNSIPPELRDQTRRFYPIKIDFPTDERQLLEDIKILRKDFPAKEGDVADKHLAHLVKGLPLVGVELILANAHLKKEKLSADLVFEQKAKIISERTGGVLKIRRSPWTYDTIGGLDHILNYIKEVVKSIRSGDFMAVPSGILFIGAPGTGKTVCAEVIAHEAGLPFAEFGSVRDPFVGMSERNMELAIEILRANNPAIVFQDEIDTFFLQRGSVYHGDSGVSSRLTGMLMEFLSDSTLRGKIIWIGATNRPDLLDTAMIRAGRFDDKIPFLIPTGKERPAIINALLLKQKIRAEANGSQFLWELTEEDIKKISGMLDFWVNKGELSPGPSPGNDKDNDIPLTGAEIEVIIQRADRLVRRAGGNVLRLKHLEEKIKEFLPTRNVSEYKSMDRMALLSADDLSFIPENRRDEVRRLRGKSQKRTDDGSNMPRNL
ncbi:MAG: ATP-binding protein [Candidatus Nealsonbacteria bacterium]|nr:ATP-binding protein [Candidatus Nealsonbacteria bacterium]